jgi:transcriptional regulator with XRE-family HTH domain
MDRDRYFAEAQRLAAILRDEIRNQGVSIRSLEQRMGVGNSVYQKVLGGKITMTLGHLLQIADALGLEWLELFRRAYPGAAVTVVETPAAAEPNEFEAQVLDVLRRHGLLPEATSEDADSMERSARARSAARDAREAAPETAESARSSVR